MPLNHLLKITKSVLGAVLFSTILAQAAHAESIGSPATIINSSDLYSGPGVNYPVSGYVDAEQDVLITRCSGIWCLIDDEGGWIAKQDVSFGQHAGGLLQGPRFIDGRSVDGTICFYEGQHFSGASFCLESGAVARDLALLGWDDRISSIAVEDGTSVNVCRDRQFASYCIRFDQDAPTMPRLLNNAASSIQLWEPID